jgi:hypothetical protein
VAEDFDHRIDVVLYVMHVMAMLKMCSSVQARLNAPRGRNGAHTVPAQQRAAVDKSNVRDIVMAALECAVMVIELNVTLATSKVVHI